MFAVLIILAVEVSLPPTEAVISLATWDGKSTTKLKYRFETRDGKVLDGEVTLLAESGPSGPRFYFSQRLEISRWRCECLDHYVIVIRGSATSPLRSVSFRSDGWAPVYYYRPAPRWLPLAPKPREVKR
jgi:hypothetical protein